MTEENYDAIIESLRPLLSKLRTDKTALKKPKEKSSIWTDQKLTKTLLINHLKGIGYRGCCPIKAGETTTQVGLFDLDSHGGETSWDDMVKVALLLCEKLSENNLHPIPFRSSGGKGIHIYLVWDSPQDAYSVRKLIGDILTSIDYKNGANGVSRGEIEVFPKQNEVAVGGSGSQFILPLANQSEPLELMFGLQPMGKDYITNVEWTISEPVPICVREEKVANNVTLDLDVVREAVKSIPNDDTVDYDNWFSTLCSIKNAAGDNEDAYNIAKSWSESSTKHDAKKFETSWKSIDNDHDNPATAASLLFKARLEGFNYDVVKDFEKLSVTNNKKSEEIVDLPSFVRDKKGQIEATIANVITALNSPIFTGFDVGYDNFKDETLIAKAGSGQWRQFVDADYSDLRVVLSNRGFKEVGRELMRDAIASVIRTNTFDSALLWLESLEWDGVGRIEGFFKNYFGVEDSQYTKSCSTYIWSAMAGRVVTGGVKADMTPILVGEQGSGKSTGVAAMSPAPDFLTEISFGEREDDMARKMRGKLIAELGELRGLHTKELEGIKAFMTRTHEQWIPKFKEFSTTYPRRLVFIGTTNKAEFLADETGHRRWLPMKVGDVRVEDIKQDCLQLWAEARELYKSKGVCYSEAEKLAKEVHHEYEIVDDWEVIIENWLDSIDENTFETYRERGNLTTNEVLTKAFDMKPKDIHSGFTRRCAAILVKIGYVNTKRISNGKQTRVYVLNHMKS